MTREDAKEFIVQSVKDDVDIAKLANAIKTLENVWVKCSDRLPEEDGLYPVYLDSDGLKAITHVEFENGKWKDLDEWETVIEWLPIPDYDRPLVEGRKNHE